MDPRRRPSPIGLQLTERHRNQRRCTRDAMRALARRVRHLEAEIADHDAAMKALIDRAAPQLIAERGIGHVTAAAFYLAWSHPGRCHSEAACARLGGTAPIEVTSGQNHDRHRLNRGGDRQLNRALSFVAVTRQRCCPTRQDYLARRTSEGKTEREAIHCLERFIARRVWRLLEHPELHLDTTWKHRTGEWRSRRWRRGIRRRSRGHPSVRGGVRRRRTLGPPGIGR
jgi:transposase